MARRMLRDQGVMATSGRLSAMDAAFLYLERPVQRLHVGSVSLLDGPVPYGAFVELTVQRLARLPRYAQRPVRPALDWALPSWQDVPRFDPRHHIRHVGVPPPGGDAELHTLIDELMAAPLDPDSPLWETYLIDGLADGRAAILNKVHHCMIDGVSGAQLLEVLSDPASELATEPAAPSPMLRTHGSGGARPWSAHAAVEAASTLARWALEPPSRLPFNAPISAERRLRWTVLPLERLLAVRGAVGCKVNDVVLSVITGGLRRWLTAHARHDRSTPRARHGAGEHAHGRRPSHARQPRVRDVPGAAGRHRRPARPPAQGGRAHERTEGAGPGARDGPPAVARRRRAGSAQRPASGACSPAGR